MKGLIIFDLDGTLAESKSDLDSEMATLLARLLGTVDVAIISVGAWGQFEKQVLAFLPHDERLKRLCLLPTCGTKFYRFEGAWTKLYSEDFTGDEKKTIIAALDQAVRQAGYIAEKRWGGPIEDRGSQITFSDLGQAAPLDEKEKWDSNFAKRKAIKAVLAPLIPAFSIQYGGSTSIDVTRPGIDKAYGVWKLHETLGIAVADMIFVGDAIFPGGNDIPRSKRAPSASECATRTKRRVSSKQSARASRPAIVIKRSRARGSCALYSAPAKSSAPSHPPANPALRRPATR
jgi:HAD superfamily hydrolase (TIGR01484 family)